MSKPINESKALTASGGGDNTYSGIAVLRTGSVKIQVEVGGATTDADVFVEARLDEGLGWSTLESATTVSGGYSTIWSVDTDDLRELRVRVVNNDGTNDGNVSVVVRSD